MKCLNSQLGMITKNVLNIKVKTLKKRILLSSLHRSVDRPVLKIANCDFGKPAQIELLVNASQLCHRLK